MGGIVRRRCLKQVRLLPCSHTDGEGRGKGKGRERAGYFFNSYSRMHCMALRLIRGGWRTCSSYLALGFEDNSL